MAGKSLDQLNLSDAPLPQEPVDPRHTDWYKFSQDIEDLLAQGRVTYAETTLRDIQQTVESTHRVSEGQRRAVTNIERGAERGMRFKGSRRYEGYGR